MGGTGVGQEQWGVAAFMLVTLGNWTGKDMLNSGPVMTGGGLSFTCAVNSLERGVGGG